MDPVDMFQKRDDALHRVRDAWQDIIDRYSSQVMQKHADVVDLQTGHIFNDNGHLRSLTDRKDSIWAYEETNTDGDEKKSLKLTKSKQLSTDTKTNTAIEVIDLDPIPVSRQHNYKHLTRSKVAGDDNLILHNATKNSGILPSYTNKFRTRSGIDTQNTQDPLNMLKKLPQLDTPSKVRRLRKAMDKHVDHKPIHTLVIHSSRKSSRSILKSQSGSQRSKLK